MSDKSAKLKSNERKRPYEDCVKSEASASSSSSKQSETSAASTSGVPAQKRETSTDLRLRRLMKEFQAIQISQKTEAKPILSATLIEDNLCEWHVRLFAIDEDSLLAKDMKERKIEYILLHLSFPKDYPFSPPFMRVVEPHIEKGFVLECGAICMEILTPRGWASTYTVEALIIQFSASLVKGKGRISDIPLLGKQYTKNTAKKVFDSVVRTHEKFGWNTPALSEG